MPDSSEKILRLRQLLDDRFGRADLPQEELYSTSLSALDEIGIPRSTLTEIVSSPAEGPGGGLMLYGLLHAALGHGERVILIDGQCAFSPQGLPQAELNRLLWTRCREASETIKAADLALRDGNVPLVVLLLTLNPTQELRRIPATAWHRLNMLAEKSRVTLLAFTPHAQIGCARLRLSVGGAFPLEKLHECRSDLLPSLEVQVMRRRTSTERRTHEELRGRVCA